MRARLGLLVAGALMILAGCGGGSGGGGSSATSTSVRPGTATEDLALLQTITADLLASSALEVEKRIVETDTMRCTGTGTNVDAGRKGDMTLKLKRPAGDVTASLGKVVSALRQANDKHFGGRGSLDDQSAPPQGTVHLYADGFVITVSMSGSDWSLHASGPCRL